MICADSKIKWIRTSVSQIWNSATKEQFAIGTSVEVTDEYEQHENQSLNLIKNDLIKLSPSFLWSIQFDKNTGLQLNNQKQIIEKLKGLETELETNGQYILLFDVIGNNDIYITQKSLEKISGYSFEKDHNFSDLEPNSHTFHHDDITKFHYMPSWSEKYTFDWRMTCANGKIKKIRTTRSCIRDIHNKRFYSFDICTVITKPEANLPHKLHGKLFDKFLNTLYSKDLSEEIIKLIYLSNEFELITGYKKSDFINRTRSLQSILHLDSQACYNGWLKSKKTHKNTGLKIVTPQNRIVEIKTSILSKESKEGKIIYYGKAVILNVVINDTFKACVLSSKCGTAKRS